MNHRNLEIAFVSDGDVNNARHWSGTSLSMHRALEVANTGTLHTIGPLHYNVTIGQKLKWYTYNRLLNLSYLWTMDPKLLKTLSRQTADSIAALPNLDLIFGPGNHSSPLTYLDADKPIVFWGDATFKLLLETYGFAGKGLCKENIEHGHKNQQEILRRCTLAVYASAWAAQSAINDYGTDPEKVLILPFGPNLKPDYTQEEIEDLIEARPRVSCKLLFVGVDWDRKRADLAIDVARSLNAQGLRTELTIVGCPAAHDQLPEFVRVVGLLVTEQDDNKALLSNLFAESHFLLVPSKAEAFGIVFAEANAFGVPNISCRVGGIPSAITDGVSGKLFAPEAEADEYAQFIMSTLSNWTTYREFCLSSYSESRTRLNWSVSASALMERMRLLI